MARRLEQLLTAYPSNVQELACAARQSLNEWLPGVEETEDGTAPVIGFGYGPGYKGMVCTLLLSKTGVKIGIAYGSQLADPHGLLEGKGKVHRFVQLRAVSDLGRKPIKELVKDADEAWKARSRC